MRERTSLGTPRLIEAGFPCHQVGAETRRERGASSALPPLYYLHVWWARRPLTPSRAAVLASILPADTDPDWFLRQLGIERVEAVVNGVPWILTGSLLERVKRDNDGSEYLDMNSYIANAMVSEQERRASCRDIIRRLREREPSFREHPILDRWETESAPLPEPFPQQGSRVQVRRVAADPAHTKERLNFKDSGLPARLLGDSFSWDIEDLYGYDRAFNHQSDLVGSDFLILDPTAGGGSIPFEALRLGMQIVANELNPVACVILEASLRYPVSYGESLSDDIRRWATRLLERVNRQTSGFFPRGQALPQEEKRRLEAHLVKCPELIPAYDYEEPQDYIFARQVTCPHCGGEAPLLNTCWLTKNDDPWGVRIVPDGQKTGGKVTFETYRVVSGKGPLGENPNFATVSGGNGLCVHCGQAISADEIKAQARGESPLGKWKDRLYAVVAVRLQPNLDKNGKPRKYKTGPRAGEIMTEKVRYFRAPNAKDLEALAQAEKYLEEHCREWEAKGLIPTETIPTGNKTAEPLRVGMTRWCDMFTPRQLVGHVTMVEELNRLKPEILKDLGPDRGRAVVTYLQFVIDKCVDYNSRQTRWVPQRSIVTGTFGRHDFSVKWTFGEMVFSGPHSGAAWALDQVVEAYEEIAKLVEPVRDRLGRDVPVPRVICSTAAKMDLPDRSVDVICMDPPYYNNVQYAELSDYFYVWEKRTLKDLYPELFQRRLTNKQDEAVANPARDGSNAQAAKRYQEMMAEIFGECRRVLKDDGIMTLMFTHKTQEAWEALTRSLMETGWVITSSMPVESEFGDSLHQKDKAAAASSVFLSCRKRMRQDRSPTLWSGFGGSGVVPEIQRAVLRGLEEMERLHLGPVDEMVASYGRALRVLSERWPVLEGDEPVSPTRAMNEAAAVVAQYQVERITKGRLKVADLDSETAFCLVVLSVFGVSQFPYDQALNLSRSLGLRLRQCDEGYSVENRAVGMNREVRQGQRTRLTGQAGESASAGYYAPLVVSGSRVRLVMPEERNRGRVLEDPKTQWDWLHGVLLSYRDRDIPGVRAFLEFAPARRMEVVTDILSVWASQVGDEGLVKEARAILFGLR